MSFDVKSCDVLNKINSDFQALSPALQSSIKNIIENEHLTEYKVTVSDFDANGNNFCGKLYEITIKSEVPESEKEINIFVKEKITMKNVTSFNVDQLYTNEELVYKYLSKVIEKLQDQANVPSEERFKMAKAYDQTSNEAIILENLGSRDFKTFDKEEFVSLKFFELSVQELAKFHALSFVIENKMPEYFKKILVLLEKSMNMINFDEDWEKLMRNICKYITTLYDDETKIKVEKFTPVLLEKLPKYYKDQTSVCTISHGDYRINNIMVRHVEGEPVEVIPIDYQFITYGSPIRDLLYFIFTGTDREFRRKHLNDLKELYFETLSRFLKYFDMDVETVYPREEFEKLYTERLDFGLMMTLFISVYLFAPDTGFDVENSNLSNLPYRPNKFFEDRLKGMVDDFVQWGYL